MKTGKIYFAYIFPVSFRQSWFVLLFSIKFYSYVFSHFSFFIQRC